MHIKKSNVLIYSLPFCLANMIAGNQEIEILISTTSI